MLEQRSGGFLTRRLLALLVTLLAASTAMASATPDYGLLEDALLQNVRNGYVDYDGLATNPGFASFIADLAKTPAPTERDAALAYYINAYNALAIQGILDGGSPAHSRRRFFAARKFTLGGARLSLEEIEQQRLQPFGEPRAFLALACAALSCPRLANHAYLAATLDQQLDEAARRFVNDVTRNRFDIPQKTAFVSHLFDWHRTDFEAAVGGSMTAWLVPHVEEPASRAALREGRLTLRYLDFDWDLNGRFTRQAVP